MEKSSLPEGGIKFFASSPHARKAGAGLWTKIIRGGKEIVEINRDDNYDFNYQVWLVFFNFHIYPP